MSTLALILERLAATPVCELDGVYCRPEQIITEQGRGRWDEDPAAAAEVIVSMQEGQTLTRGELAQARLLAEGVWLLGSQRQLRTFVANGEQRITVEAHQEGKCLQRQHLLRQVLPADTRLMDTIKDGGD